MSRVNCECKKIIKILLKCNYKYLMSNLNLIAAYLYCLILFLNSITWYKLTALIYKWEK